MLDSRGLPKVLRDLADMMEAGEEAQRYKEDADYARHEAIKWKDLFIAMVCRVGGKVTITPEELTGLPGISYSASMDGSGHYTTRPAIPDHLKAEVRSMRPEDLEEGN